MSASAVMRNPPKKRPGQGMSPRVFRGKLLDVHATAELLGCSEKVIRARASRGLVPCRYWGGRLLFLRNELELFMERLAGVRLEEALGNLRIRAGGSADDRLSTGTPLVVPQTRL